MRSVKSQIRQLPPSLSRRAASIRPRLKIIAVCEGKNTEPDYLEKFCRDHANGLVKIVSVKGIGVAQTVVKEASKHLDRMQRSKTSSFEKFDQCWAIFDHDNHPNVEQCVKSAREIGLKVAFSNPCIELWGVLHFADYGRPSDGTAVQAVLRRFMPSYDPTGSKLFDYDLMKIGYKEAVRRAKLLIIELEKVGTPLGNPHTDFFILTELIRSNGKSISSKKVKNRNK